MEGTNRRPSERAEHRLHTSREELVERLMQAVPADGTAEPLAGLRLIRYSAPTPQGHGTSAPAFCVIAQGSKEILLGDRRYQYDPAHYLITTAELPIATRITEASLERPYLSVVLTLEPTVVGSVILEAGQFVPRRPSPVLAVDVSLLDAGLLDAVVRLVRLVETPSDARILAPLITREIGYRLLMSEQGGRLRQLAELGGVTHRIAEAVNRLRHRVPVVTEQFWSLAAWSTRRDRLGERWPTGTELRI